jgi:hypothetical protein
MDRRRQRSEKTREAISAALERLKVGHGTHARHAGLRVRITKQSVAREANVSSATLYRFPDMLRLIEATVGQSQDQRRKGSEQRRLTMLNRIAELELQNSLLLSENLRLMRLLKKHDPSLGESPPIDLNSHPVATRRRR